MDIEREIIELKEKNAVLEYRVQEQQEHLHILKNGLDTITDMLRQLRDNPFGGIS